MLPVRLPKVTPANHGCKLGVDTGRVRAICVLLLRLIHVHVSVLLNHPAEDVTLDVQQRSGI